MATAPANTSTLIAARRGVKKTKIIATVGPASANPEILRELILAGVNLFRLNFAHGEHTWLGGIVTMIRQLETELAKPLGILGDLSGPKIRLGELPPAGLSCKLAETYRFVRTPGADAPRELAERELTCNYERLIDELSPGNLLVLADGSVSMRVMQCDTDAGFAECVVERAGLIRSRQGINLPGVKLSIPCLTDKDRLDVVWAVDQRLDYLGLSFVRDAHDVRELREMLNSLSPEPPRIVAKIEKPEAVDDLSRILDATDAVMVARGDLGVEVDIVRVPVLQKRIIRECNAARIPVITATQMLESMHQTPFPTRAEASDVANAVIDGTDAVMLSGETAVGMFPVKAVETMAEIVREAERLVTSRNFEDTTSLLKTRALAVTEAITRAAGTAAEHLRADVMVVCTHSGRTAMAISKQRSPIPLLALTDNLPTSRRMTLFWGVIPHLTKAVRADPRELLDYVIGWGQSQNLVASKSKLVVIFDSKWATEGHDLLMVHVVP